MFCSVRSVGNVLYRMLLFVDRGYEATSEEIVPEDEETSRNCSQIEEH
jgi:hypothetical protein